MTSAQIVMQHVGMLSNFSEIGREPRHIRRGTETEVWH